METKRKATTLRINRRLIAILALIIATLGILEIYAHTYVELHHLSTITEAEALKLSPSNYTATYTFMSSGGRWLTLWKIEKPLPSVNYAWVYLFKIEQSRSFFIPNIDLVIPELRPTSNSTGGHFWAEIDGILYESNRTIIRIQYHFGEIGTYQIDFGLRVKIYEETLLGLLPKEEIKIPMNTTLYYGP
ncbi:MAG: hypothetical protein OEY24_04185 [Candidatus Bathyarchaeota archaeon]|nr:hypothetical protein [Candidatus Bathyarchaeota archaeon]MDH5494881.1 hypothetical protein [Candidatus Bathyarchaeota archaeon]